MDYMIYFFFGIVLLFLSFLFWVKRESDKMNYKKGGKK